MVYNVPMEGGPGPKLTCFEFFSRPDWNVTSGSSPYDEDAYYCPAGKPFSKVIHAKMTPTGPDAFNYVPPLRLEPWSFHQP